MAAILKRMCDYINSDMVYFLRDEFDDDIFLQY